MHISHPIGSPKLAHIMRSLLMYEPCRHDPDELAVSVQSPGQGGMLT